VLSPAARLAGSRDGDKMVELPGGGGVFRQQQEFTAVAHTSDYRTNKPQVFL